MRNSIGSLLCLCLLGIPVSHAAETDQHKQLSVDEARLLAQDNGGRLALDGLETLSPEVATALAQFKGWLSLDGLTTISDEVAAALQQHEGDLHLSGVTKISDKAAQALAGHRGELDLSGLTSITDESAKALAGHTSGRLMLNGLTTLSNEAAKVLAKRKGTHHFFKLQLHGLTSLSPEVAAALASMHPHTWDGKLPAVTSVSDNAAAALSGYEMRLFMPGLTSLSDQAATTLGVKLDARLPKLTSLSPAVAKGLTSAGSNPNTKRPLGLDGLTTLSDEAAKELGPKDHRWGLSLNGLTSLTPAAASAICQRKGDLYLNGVTTLSDETIKALVTHKSNRAWSRPIVYLDGLTALSDESIAMLASWPKWSGDLPALTTLSPTGAAALVSSRNWNEELPALKTLSLETARTLAQRNGNLSLDGLTSLSDELAEVLAKHRGGTLSLGGLTSLSDTVAATLAQHQGGLSLDGLQSLSMAEAKALAAYQPKPGKKSWDKVDWLFLDGVTKLSDEAASALAQRPGVVSLLSLETVSIEATKTLFANGRVALPAALKLAAIAHEPVAAADQKLVNSLLNSHCADCHGDGEKEGDFELERLAKDDISARVAYASIFERLREGDMPPADETQPKATDVNKVVGWIGAKLDTPLPTPPTYYAVDDRPVDGNQLPHVILFGGPRGPSVPPPPRLWRLSPAAYAGWTVKFKATNLLKPFDLILDPGVRDYANLYVLDEGATNLLLTNADQIINSQATAAGKGPLAPLLNPQKKATDEQLAAAIAYEYQLACARPPNKQEIENLTALYHDVAREGDLALAGRSVLQALLMTPEAIFRFEVGQGTEVRPGVQMLSPAEIAQAVSLALSTRLDPGLKAAAAAGKLTSRQEVAKSVEQMLGDPKVGKSRALWFFREYFDYYKAPEVFKDALPKYVGVKHGDAVGGYVANTDYLVADILGRDTDVLKELLTTTAYYPTDRYHFNLSSAINDGQPSPLFRHVSAFAQDRRQKQQGRIGILMNKGWQVAWSTNFYNDVVRRGRFVRERLLGGRVPALPINGAAVIPDDPHRTLRQRQMATRAQVCWNCHYKMDELGLPFENTTHFGLPRKAEVVLDLQAMERNDDNSAQIYRDAPLDTTGAITFSGEPGLDGPVRDAPELLRRLAKSDRVRQVFIRYTFRYFMGRNETPGDAVTLQEAEKAYLDNGGSFKAMLVSLLSSESFLYRTIPYEGVNQ